MTKKNNDKSFFLYTALIFFVALILIILSLFGQEHINQLNTITPVTSAPETSQTPPPSSITERAAALSESNRQLTEEITELKKQIETLKSENEALSKKVTLNDLLLNAYHLHQEGNTDQAKDLLTGIEKTFLSPDQLILFETISQ